MKTDYIKGRGSQIRTANPYAQYHTVQEHPEGLDEPLIGDVHTQVYFEHPKQILNKIESPDVGMEFSLNPYQGCEHGCIYCYARNSHQYWGFSAGLDFESRIIVKKNAVELLDQTFAGEKWKPAVISLAGNTDCYQPLERKFRLTRGLLEVCLKYKNPVGIITKNQLILRDLDILEELNKYQLVQVFVSITSLDEDIRMKLEPRTATYRNRLKVIEAISRKGIPAGVMVAPIIPGLNNYHMPGVIEAAAQAGAYTAGYTIVRLNGAIADIFTDWVHKSFPDAADKILKQIAECHGGTLNDSRFGKRMRGDGKLAESIRQLFTVSRNRFMAGKPKHGFNLTAFERPPRGQLYLF
jgi:DNA repair photolyase